MQMKSILLVVGVLFLVSLVGGCKRSASGGSSIESVKTEIEDKMSTESWPSVVGKKAEEAKKIILEERPELKIYILPEDSMMTMDYRLERVRIFVDENQIVVKPPKVG